MRLTLRVFIILLFVGVSVVVLMPSLFDVNSYKNKILFKAYNTSYRRMT
jgi:hypothetical protein